MDQILQSKATFTATQCLPTHSSSQSEREAAPTEGVSRLVYCCVAIIGNLPESPQEAPKESS